jgi:hypothetical protein
MAADPLEQVLRLVADGRLTAEEAGPILAALDESTGGETAPGTETGRTTEAPGGFGPTPPPGAASRPDAGSRPGAGTGPKADADDRPGHPATSLRIEVSDAGRKVVNLRLPLAVGRFALDRVPGLSADQVTRVREAMNSGFRGPVLVVDDDGDGVRISLE